MSKFVKPISGGEQLMLDACDGKRTIVKAIDIFLYIDSDFKNWNTDEAGTATPKMAVSVYELVKNANFSKMFDALADDPSKLVLEQNQILNFVQKHRDWLQQGGWATFFLFRADGQFFVARVDVDSDGELYVCVSRFGDAYLWDAFGRPRLVVPQL